MGCLTQILVLCCLDLSQSLDVNSLHLVAESQFHPLEPQACCPHLPAPLLVSPGLGVVLGHLGQFLLTVKGQELHPVAGSILEVGDGLAGVGEDDA